VFVVNKADRGGTEATVRDLQGMLMLGEMRDWSPPIVPTVAIDGRGLDELVDAVAAHRAHLASSGELAARRELRVRDELRGIVLEWVAKLTPLWHGVNLARMFCVDNIDWTTALVNVVFLVVVLVSGWWVAIRTLTRRMAT